MSRDYYMPESMLKQHSYAEEQLFHALRKRKSLITDVLEKEQLTYTIAGLRESTGNTAWLLGMMCHDNRELNPDEELKAIKEWFCKTFEEEYRSSLKMADGNPEDKEKKEGKPEKPVSLDELKYCKDFNINKIVCNSYDVSNLGEIKLTGKIVTEPDDISEDELEETKINVYENMWNTLKDTIEAKNRLGWCTYNYILDEMNQIERLQKGIPDDDEEEETEEDE